MVKKYKKEPYSISLSPRTVENLKYYKYTHPDAKLSQEIEATINAIIPDMRG